MPFIHATEFKAKCLAIPDSVARTGEGVTILKRGKPVAQLVPVTADVSRSPQASLRGTVEILGDIVGPFLPASAWEVERPGR